MRLLVTYDLGGPVREYEDIVDAINDLGPTWHILGSVWLVNTPLTAEEAVSYLKSHLDEDDGLFAMDLEGEAAWSGLKTEVAHWIAGDIREAFHLSGH